MLLKNRDSTQVDNAPQKTVLIVEDDEEIGYMLEEVFDMETDFRVIVAKRAREAFKIMRSTLLHLILLDYQLPDMDGLEVYDRMRNIGEFERIPVVLMSANLPCNELVKRHLLGLAKPFDIDDVIYTARGALAS